MIHVADHSVNTLESLTTGAIGTYVASVLFLTGSIVLLASKTAVACAPVFLTSLVVAGSVITTRYAYTQMRKGSLEESDIWLLKGWVTTALTVASMVVAFIVFQCPPLPLALISLGFGIAVSDFYVAHDLIAGRPGEDRALFTRF